MKLFNNSKVYNEFSFEKESDFEREIVVGSKIFFGQGAIYIDAKKKIETKTLGGSIPDGFLFDLSDIENPEFYLVEVELSKHNFYNHIFPQITKFIGFYRNSKSLNLLIEKIFSIITNDNILKNQFKKLLGEKEIYKFIKDCIEKSQNVLLIIDGDKKELPEIMETYSETWGKMVKLIVIKKYHHEGNYIYTMHPEFERLEYGDIEDEPLINSESPAYTEHQHLEGTDENIRDTYNYIKTTILSSNPEIIFNPQKYYISIKKKKNIAFLKIRRKKIAIVVLYPEENTRQEIKHHHIKTLVPSVQRFWNGPSCAIMLENMENIDEIITLINKLIKQSK